MHYFQAVQTTCQSFFPILGRSLLVAAAVLLSGCNDERIDDLQAQLERMQSQLHQQAQVLETLESANTAHHAVLEQLSEWEHVKFKVAALRYEISEKAFEPLVIGEAQLQLVGEAKPELIFVEWALELSIDGDPMEPVTYIQRVENGEATFKFVHPLPRHNLKKDAINIVVVPTGWYLAHVAKVASD